MGCGYSYLNDFVSVGAIAMTGFFMLSGYALRLVYGEQDLIEKHNLAKFYVKRLLSIIPLYYAFALIYILFFGHESLTENLLLFPIEALGLQSTFTSLFSVSHNGGTWFISCILIAYVLFPFFQSIFKQIGERSKVIILLGCIIIEFIAIADSKLFHAYWLYDSPFYRILEFTCGLLIADLNINYNNKVLHILRSRWMLVLSFIVMVVGVSFIQHKKGINDPMLLNPVVLPCFVAMLISLGKLKMPLLEKSEVIGYLGKISYPFFLVQLFAWQASKILIDIIGYDSNWIRILVSFIFCIIVAIAAYELIQRPISNIVQQKVFK